MPYSNLANYNITTQYFITSEFVKVDILECLFLALWFFLFLNVCGGANVVLYDSIYERIVLF